jgi:hypothetical protein
MSNTKQIQAVHRFTGEITSGSIEKIASLIGMHRNTLSGKKLPFEYKDFIISNAQSEIQTHNPNAQKIEINVQMHNEIVSNAQIPTKPLPVADPNAQPWDKYRQAQANHLTPTTEPEKQKTIIPSGPCVIKGCGRITYHTQTIDGEKVFICFYKCQDILKHNSDTIVRQDLKEVITAIKNSLPSVVTTGDKVIPPPKPRVPIDL